MDVSSPAQVISLQASDTSATLAATKSKKSSLARMQVTAIANVLVWLAGVAIASWQAVVGEAWAKATLAYLLCFLPVVVVLLMVTLYWSTVSSAPTGPLWQAGSEDTSLSDAHWRATRERATKLWENEQERFSQGWRAAAAHGLTFALLSTLTLVICMMIVAPYLLRGEDHIETSQRALVAVAVGTATAFAFVNDLARTIHALQRWSGESGQRPVRAGL